MSKRPTPANTAATPPAPAAPNGEPRREERAWQETAPPKEGRQGARGRFLQRLNEDWPSEALLKHVKRRGSVPSPSTLRLTNLFAVIGSDRFAADLGDFVNVRPVLPAFADAPLPPERPADLLLIEGCWPTVGHPWRKALLNLSSAERGLLSELIAACRRDGVPVVLWITDEPEAADHFAHLIDEVDVAFAPPGSRLTGRKIAVLDQGFNVKQYNPFKPDIYQFRRDAAPFGFLIDGAYELSRDYPTEEGLKLLEPFLPYNAWLVDSSYSLRNNNHSLSPVLRRRFLGCPDADQWAFLTKCAQAVYYPPSMGMQRPAYLRRRMLEAAGSKTICLLDSGVAPARADTEMLSLDAAPHGGLTAVMAALLEDRIAAMAAQHRAWRTALASHTLFERCETIMRAVKVEPAYNAESTPAVNVVVPTVRPDLIPYAIRAFQAQTYGPRHLTIVANGVSVPAEVEALAADAENVKLTNVPRERSIGYCMNYGIDSAEAAWWAKMDDDDVYGPEYLGDLMAQRKYVDFDVTGKAAVFTYLEADDTLTIRRPDNIDTYETFLCGGTLLARNDGAYFPEDIRGYADTLFLLNLAANPDARLVAGDPFNFVQVRRLDASSHTWTAGTHSLNLRGPKRSGLSLDHVMI